MNFTWWIRFFAEASLFITIAALTEIYGSAKDVESPTSYTFALFTLLILVAGIFLMLFHLFMFNHLPNIEQGMFSAFYQGVKPTMIARLNMFFFIVRRCLMACVIVFLHTDNFDVQLFHFFEIQAFAIGY
jgi:hypothetical protein